MSVAFSDPPPRIQPMSPDDLREVLDIEAQAYRFPWSEGVFRDCLRVGYCCSVVRGTGLVDGYGIMSLAAWEAHILNLCVRPAAQGRGVGAGLLDHLCDVARDQSIERVILEVRPSNTLAIRLYERAGFERIGLRRGYYPAADGREDALVFSLSLPDAR